MITDVAVGGSTRFMNCHSAGNYTLPTILCPAQVEEFCYASTHTSTQTHMLICKDFVPLMMCGAATTMRPPRNSIMQTSLYFQQSTRWSYLNKHLAPFICFFTPPRLIITPFHHCLCETALHMRRMEGRVKGAKMSAASRWLST